jgi:hypothetical protein
MNMRIVMICIISIFSFSVAHAAELANPRSMAFPPLVFRSPKQNGCC